MFRKDLSRGAIPRSIVFIFSILSVLINPVVVRGEIPSNLLETKLNNNLTVILEENPSAPVVALQMWVKVGSADEEDSEAGLAHTIEHMLFKGTKKRRIGEIAREIEAMGGNINAWTSFDQTVYHIVLASRFLDAGLEILADAIKNSIFDPQELEREKMVVIEELKRSEDSPSRKLSKRLMKTAYSSHSYRRPIIGFKETVKSIDRDKAMRFYRKWYVPNNMTLVISGNFKNEEILPLVEETFEDFPEGPDPRMTPRPEEPVQKEIKKIVLSEDVQETHFELAFHIPGLNHKDVYSLDVLSTILGGGRSSILYRKIKAEKALVRSISTYAMTPKDPGLFFISAELEAKDLEQALREILKEVEKVREDGVTDEELGRAKLNLESDFIYQRETIQGRARQLGYYETVASDLSFEERYLKGIDRVTSEDVKRIVKKYLKATNLTMGILIPEGKRAILDEEGLEDIARLFGEEPGRGDQIIKRVLDNGVTLLIKENHSNPTVSFYGVFIGALLTENEDNNGITNFVARMLTKGTDIRSAEEIAREVESMAGGLSGFSGRNTFGASANFLSRFFEEGIEIFSDVLLNPAFDGEELEKTRRDIIADIKSEEDSLSRITFNLLNKTLYHYHPYRMNPLGIEKTVSRFGRNELIRYYKRLAIPQNLVLTIVGDIETEVVEEKVRALFGELEKGEPLSLNLPQERGAEKIRKTEIVKEREQTHIAMGFLGPSIDSPDKYPVDILSNILATQGGRLFIELRDKQGLAYVVTAFSREGIGTGAFVVYMATSPENLDRSVKGIKEVLQGVLQEKVTEEELQRSKGHLIGIYEIGLQSNSSQASDMALNEILGLGYDEFRRYPEKISRVTLEDVQRVAREYIDLDAYTLAIVRPPEANNK